MNKYLYVRCDVYPQDLEEIAGFQTISEKIFGPKPDIMPEVFPGQLSFKHTFVEAENEDDAYAIGSAESEEGEDVITFNDYVILL